jgi:hypothetical protein
VGKLERAEDIECGQVFDQHVTMVDLILREVLDL